MTCVNYLSIYPSIYLSIYLPQIRHLSNISSCKRFQTKFLEKNNNSLFQTILSPHADVNECMSGSHRCSPFASCHNNNGSYRCQCIDTYTGDGKTCRGKMINILTKKHFDEKFFKHINQLTAPPKSIAYLFALSKI